MPIKENVWVIYIYNNIYKYVILYLYIYNGSFFSSICLQVIKKIAYNIDVAYTTATYSKDGAVLNIR